MLKRSHLAYSSLRSQDHPHAHQSFHTQNITPHIISDSSFQLSLMPSLLHVCRVTTIEKKIRYVLQTTDERMYYGLTWSMRKGTVSQQ